MTAGSFAEAVSAVRGVSPLPAGPQPPSQPSPGDNGVPLSSSSSSSVPGRDSGVPPGGGCVTRSDGDVLLCGDGRRSVLGAVQGDLDEIRAVLHGTSRCGQSRRLGAPHAASGGDRPS